jgi:CheY-like chemotaxis protein
VTSLNGFSVLVVDDDEHMRDLLSRILAQAGYRVLAFGDGSSALGASEDHDFELLVTDVRMPGMTGWELAERLRGGRPGLKVLVLSGAAGEPSRVPGDGTVFLPKPFRVGTLLDHAHRLLEAR